MVNDHVGPKGTRLKVWEIAFGTITCLKNRLHGIAQRLLGLPSKLRAEIEGHETVPKIDSEVFFIPRRLFVRAGYLAGLPDGPRSFAIIVRAVRGVVPHRFPGQR